MRAGKREENAALGAGQLKDKIEDKSDARQGEQELEGEAKKG